VSPYTAVLAARDHPEEYQEPEPLPFFNVEGLYDWLMDPRYR
jgi:hypothetical protein